MFKPQIFHLHLFYPNFPLTSFLPMMLARVKCWIY